MTWGLFSLGMVLAYIVCIVAGAILAVSNQERDLKRSYLYLMVGVVGLILTLIVNVVHMMRHPFG